MKSILLFASILISFTCDAQIGIGTTGPTNTLDVNGGTRVRTVPSNTRLTAAKDSIVVTDKFGNLQRTTSKLVIESHFKTYIKGGFSATSDQSLALSSGTVKVPFNYEEFDENDEFDTSANTFEAKITGIYSINVQVKSNASSISTTFGVAILKNNVVIARNSFANIGVTIPFISTTNVTPPIRCIQTLAKLTAGDKITFNMYSDLINIGLISAKEDSFFTIHQVR